MIYEFIRYICDVKQPGFVTVSADTREEAVEKAYAEVNLPPQHYNRDDTVFVLYNTEDRGMIVGTNHFVSKQGALIYYKPQRYTAADIDRMIAEGEIVIGAPEIKPGQRLIVIDEVTRYGIEDVG